MAIRRRGWSSAIAAISEIYRDYAKGLHDRYWYALGYFATIGNGNIKKASTRNDHAKSGLINLSWSAENWSHL